MNYYLAPLEGITTYIYRNAFEKYFGGVDKYFTPFLSNIKIIPKEYADVNPANNHVPYLVPQILSNQSDVFLSIADELVNMGYHEINLNLGCPSGTVVAKKRGAGFLDTPDLLDRFLYQIFEKLDIKISVKTRLGILSPYEWEDLIEIYRKYPISELIIHPRYQKDLYKGKYHLDEYNLALESNLNSPIIYNGDIVDSRSFSEITNTIKSCNGFMLGRGAISNPALIHSLKNSANEKPDMNTLKAFHDEILDGYRIYMGKHNDMPVLFKMKEIMAYMSKQLPDSEKTLKKIRKTNRLSDYISYTNTLFI